MFNFCYIIILYIFLLLFTGTRHGGAAEVLDGIKISAVSGGEAILPCDTHSPQPPDALLLVVWYKDDVPVYR